MKRSSHAFAGSEAPFVPLIGVASAEGIGTGPPGEFGSLAVKTSTPVSVTNIVCSTPPSAQQHRVKHACKLTKLGTPLPILRRTRPIIRPRLIPMRPQINHRLNRKAHARLRLPNRLVLAIMRDIRRRVEQLVHTMSAISLYDGAVSRFGELFNGVARVAEEHAGFHEIDGGGQTVAGGFDDADRFGVG